MKKILLLSLLLTGASIQASSYTALEFPSAQSVKNHAIRGQRRCVAAGAELYDYLEDHNVFENFLRVGMIAVGCAIIMLANDITKNGLTV